MRWGCILPPFGPEGDSTQVTREPIVISVSLPLTPVARLKAQPKGFIESFPKSPSKVVPELLLGGCKQPRPYGVESDQGGTVLYVRGNRSFVDELFTPQRYLWINESCPARRQIASDHGKAQN